jgi:hypothetical protein
MTGRKVEMKNRLDTIAQMSFADLCASIERDAAPPGSLPPAVQALWHDARGDWPTAHRCAQDDSGPDAAWVHAYLHRKEGDLANAGDWDARAGRPVPPAHTTLAAEWAEIARALLER